MRKKIRAVDPGRPGFHILAEACDIILNFIVLLLKVVVEALGELLLKLGPGGLSAAAGDVVAEVVVSGVELVDEVAVVVHVGVLEDKSAAFVVHLKHLVSPEIFLLELLALDSVNGRVDYLEALAGCVKRNAVGIRAAGHKHISRRNGGKVIFAVALGISRQRNEHELVFGDVAPNSLDFLNRPAELAVERDVEQAEAVLDAGAGGVVIAAAPVVGALVVNAFVLYEIVDKLVGLLKQRVVKIGNVVALVVLFDELGARSLLNESAVIGVAVKGEAVFVGVREVYAHVIEFVPSPVVVGVKLGGIVVAVFVYNSAVIRNDVAEGDIGDESEVAIAESEGLGRFGHIRPKRIGVIDVAVDGNEGALDAVHREGGLGAYAAGIEIGRVVRNYQVGESVPLGVEGGFPEFYGAAVFFTESPEAGVYNFVLGIVVHKVNFGEIDDV